MSDPTDPESDQSIIVSRSQLIKLLQDVKAGKVSVEHAEKRISFSGDMLNKSVYDFVRRQLNELIAKFPQ